MNRNRSESSVREIEHTADLGMEVEAQTLDGLFRQAAVGMMELVRADDDAPRTAGERTPRTEENDADGADTPLVRDIAIDLPKAGIADLLVRWLRELLYLQEVEGFVYGDVDFERLDASGLRSTVTARSHPTPPIRELKGVTYHGLEVGREDGGWRARVIFDI
ncbi:MAG: archease [Gemmatimonadota bacterium]